MSEIKSVIHNTIPVLTKNHTHNFSLSDPSMDNKSLKLKKTPRTRTNHHQELQVRKHPRSHSNELLTTKSSSDIPGTSNSTLYKLSQDNSPKVSFDECSEATLNSPTSTESMSTSSTAIPTQNVSPHKNEKSKFRRSMSVGDLELSETQNIPPPERVFIPPPTKKISYSLLSRALASPVGRRGSLLISDGNKSKIRASMIVEANKRDSQHHQQPIRESNCNNITPTSSEKKITINNNGSTGIDQTNSKKKLEQLDPRIQEAIQQFNKKWQYGMDYMVKRGLIQADDTKNIAIFLYMHNEFLSKTELGEILAGNNNDVDLLTEFTELMNFDGLSFDLALRCFLSTFMLPGEAQKISRIMEVFAAKYVKANANIFPDKDAAFVLAFSLIMLNTDAHSIAISEKGRMTKEQFVKNNSGTWNGSDPPLDLLEKLYDSIVTNEIIMKTKGDPDKKGWVKSIKANEYDSGRRWLCLIGNELRWYKNPTLGKDKEKLLGFLKLEYVMVKETADNFSISNALPKLLKFYVLDDKGITNTMTTMDFVVNCETENSVEFWARSIRQNVTFEVEPDFTPDDFKKPKPKSKNKKTIKRF